jgi:integrase
MIMANVGGWVGKYYSKREKKDMYFFRVTLGNDANGKRIQPMTKGFNTERLAKKALREAQALADKGKYILSMKMSYGEYIKEWFDIRQSSLGSQTIANHSININRHIIPLIGDVQLTELNVHHIEKFLGNLRDKGLAEATIKKIFSIVSSSLISATKKDMIQKNVASFADNKPKVKRKQVDVWDEFEVKRFLEFVSGANTRYYTALHLAIATGMRQGEILGLRWQDVDLVRRQITVNQTLSHDGKEFGQPKTESSIRSISIDDRTVEVLENQRRFLQSELEANPSMYVDNDLVNCTNIGTPCKPRDLDKVWNRLRDRSGLKRIKFHSIRHTHASLLLKNNVHPKVVSERLGHSSIQITLDLYSHLSSNMQEDAATGLGKMLFDD